MDDNRNFEVPHPASNPGIVKEFESVLNEMHGFSIDDYRQENIAKCERCIYAPMCANGEFHDDEARL